MVRFDHLDLAAAFALAKGSLVYEVAVRRRSNQSAAELHSGALDVGSVRAAVSLCRSRILPAAGSIFEALEVWAESMHHERPVCDACSFAIMTW
jgi:hypothetical protein